MQITNEVLILRDMIASDIDDIIHWNTKDTEWMKWDAPWMREEDDDFDWDTYRQDKLIEIEKRKTDTSLRMRLQLCLNDAFATHIGTLSAYYIDEEYKIVESGKNIAIGMDIFSQQYRGHGYGRLAYQMYLNYLKSFGYTHVYTQTWSGNIPLIKMAEAIGFKECNRYVKLREVNHQKYDALTFVITL